MSHPHSDVQHDNIEGRKISGMLNHGHLSQAQNELFQYGKSHDVGNVANYLQKHNKGVSVEHDENGHVSALHFGKHDIYGKSAGKPSKAGGEAGAEGKGKGTSSKGGADDRAEQNTAAASSDQQKGSVTDNGRGRKEYSEQLPPDWGVMSDRQRQAWMAGYRQRSNEALHIGGPPRLGVDPDTGVWTGYAGQEPTAAERKRMEEIERDPRKMHYL
jgi:hypothetical protein